MRIGSSSSSSNSSVAAAVVVAAAVAVVKVVAVVVAAAAAAIAAVVVVVVVLVVVAVIVMVVVVIVIRAVGKPAVVLSFLSSRKCVYRTYSTVAKAVKKSAGSASAHWMKSCVPRNPAFLNHYPSARVSDFALYALSETSKEKKANERSIDEFYYQGGSAE